MEGCSVSEFLVEHPTPNQLLPLGLVLVLVVMVEQPLTPPCLQVQPPLLPVNLALLVDLSPRQPKWAVRPVLLEVPSKLAVQFKTS